MHPSVGVGAGQLILPHSFQAVRVPGAMYTDPWDRLRTLLPYLPHFVTEDYFSSLTTVL